MFESYTGTIGYILYPSEYDVDSLGLHGAHDLAASQALSPPRFRGPRVIAEFTAPRRRPPRAGRLVADLPCATCGHRHLVAAGTWRVRRVVSGCCPG